MSNQDFKVLFCYYLSDLVDLLLVTGWCETLQTGLAGYDNTFQQIRNNCLLTNSNSKHPAGASSFFAYQSTVVAMMMAAFAVIAREANAATMSPLEWLTTAAGEIPQDLNKLTILLALRCEVCEVAARILLRRWDCYCYFPLALLRTMVGST